MSQSIYEKAANALKPAEVSLQPILDAIAELNVKPADLQPVLDAIASISVPEVDLTSIHEGLQRVISATDLTPVLDAIGGIDIPTSDLSPVLTAMSNWSDQLTQVNADVLSRLDNLEFPEVDFSQVREAISGVKTTVDAHYDGWEQFVAVLSEGN